MWLLFIFLCICLYLAFVLFHVIYAQNVIEKTLFKNCSFFGDSINILCRKCIDLETGKVIEKYEILNTLPPEYPQQPNKEYLS